MKTFRILFLILALTAGSISCKKQALNEVKINDYQGIVNQFIKPDKEYTTAPFFVWNYKISREEIDKYLLDFKNAGSSQVIIHPRPGLITEYLSDEWFDLYRYAVHKGKELGMNIWMYDENSYPSGFAGGNVPDQMPESYNQGTGLRMTRFETLPDTAEKYFLVLKEDEKGNFADVTSSVAAEKGKQGKYLTFHKTYYNKTDWYAGFSYVDLLLPGVTQKFIDVTMSGYEKIIPEELGTTIPGTFTDEPEIVAPGNSIRWTPDLFDVFFNQWNYDLKTSLPSLIEEVGDWKMVRHNYTSTLLTLFIERWAKPWYEYTERKGLKFTGHYWEHDWPGTRHGGDNMAMYAWHQVPAVDMLFNQFNDSTPGAQFGNIRAIKELASAANQTGRQRKLSETYGGAGWELTFAEQKRLGDWEYALGVNLMNQHLSHITLAGARKYDYPPTFTYHEPWWQDYKYINDHYARLSMLLSSGRQINDILVIEPTTTGWLYDSYVKRNPKLGDIGQSFQSFVTKLEKNQVEYDLGSEQIMKDLAEVSGNKLIVGQREYSSVIIPPMTENINLSTFKLIAKYVKKGGKLIAFSTPTLVDGKENQGLKEFFEANREMISFPESLDQATIEKYFRNEEIRFADLNGGTLYHQRRILADGHLLFMVNSDMSGTLRGKVEITGTGAIELNTLNGVVNGFPSIVEGNKVNLSFDLPPAGSLMLFIPSGNAEIPSVPKLFENERTIMADKPAVVTRDRENVLTLEFCDLQLGGEKFPELHTYYAADKVYKYYGFRNGNPWNTSVQFKNKTVERDTFGVKTGFTATYHFNVDGTFDVSSFSAVVERPYLWKVSINGNEVKQEPGMWWLDREYGVFRIGSFIKKGDNTLTVTASPMKIHAEIEPVYITGDFSLAPASKGWTIKKPVKELESGSWKEQGMPFYSWGVTYDYTFNIDKPQGKFELVAGKWNGTIAEVKVNGKAAGPVAFPPYTSDITTLIAPGENKIEFTVIGSLKNLLGPHFNNPAPGLVSPGHFRNVKAYPSGLDYQLIDYGLYGDLRLTNSY